MRTGGANVPGRMKKSESKDMSEFEIVVPALDKASTSYVQNLLQLCFHGCRMSSWHGWRVDLKYRSAGHAEPPKQRPTTMHRSMSLPWWRDSNQRASGEPGAVQGNGSSVSVLVSTGNEIGGSGRPRPS